MKSALTYEELLSERNIIRATLNFLRAYYRGWQRSGEIEVSSDLRGKGGIIADGSLTFLRADGRRFSATFEATSSQKRDEVRFRLDRRTLIWDGLTLALLLAALWVAYADIRGWFTIREAGVAGFILAPFVLAVLVFAAHNLTCVITRPRRYRYIYAVEQFKRYYADEQWIAVAEDVFPNKEGIYFKELRHQCTYNGFGLIIVTRLGEGLSPVLYITPARQQLLRRRREVQLLDVQEWGRRLAERADRQWWRRRLGKAPGKILDSISRRQLYRFRRSFYNQLIISFFSLLVIGAVYYKQIQQTEIYEPDESEIIALLEERKANRRYQPLDYRLDTPYFYPPSFDLKAVPYLKIEPLENPRLAKPAEKDKPEIIVEPGAEKYVQYDCARFYNLQTTKYIIIAGVYPTIEEARRRMREVGRQKVPANILWLGCFVEGEDAYVVYLDLLYNTNEEALREAAYFEELLSPGRESGRLKIRSLSPFIY